MVSQSISGRIIKATGGFYYVKTPGGEIIECRARGIFRRDGLNPYVGDMAGIQIDTPGKGTVTGIYERKNFLVRPPLANLDYMVVTISMASPLPNLLVADKYLAVLESKGIDAIIALTKPDLEDAGDLARIYLRTGYPVYIVNGVTGEGIDALTDALSGKFCAFSGNSGVGKSSLLNAIMPSLSLATGDISKKLGRGRHTTRHVEIYELPNGALIADTPGFSTVEIIEMSDIDKASLANCFIEFEPYLGDCRFSDCSHTREKGCAILQALENGDIEPTRHQSYILMYVGIKDIKEWEKKKI